MCIHAFVLPESFLLLLGTWELWQSLTSSFLLSGRFVKWSTSSNFPCLQHLLSSQQRELNTPRVWFFLSIWTNTYDEVEHTSSHLVCINYFSKGAQSEALTYTDMQVWALPPYVLLSGWRYPSPQVSEKLWGLTCSHSPGDVQTRCTNWYHISICVWLSAWLQTEMLQGLTMSGTRGWRGSPEMG